MDVLYSLHFLLAVAAVAIVFYVNRKSRDHGETHVVGVVPNPLSLGRQSRCV